MADKILVEIEEDVASVAFGMRLIAAASRIWREESAGLWRLVKTQDGPLRGLCRIVTVNQPCPDCGVDEGDRHGATCPRWRP